MADNDDMLQPQRMIFACSQIFNIFHPTDPIAYRIEPLIVSDEEMLHLEYPVRVPYTKGGALQLKRQMEEGIQRLQTTASKAQVEITHTLSKSFSSILGNRSLNITKNPKSSKTPEDAPSSSFGPCRSDGSEEAKDIERPQSRLFYFNRHGRMDFSLEEALFENAYLSAISSHFCYWDDPDISTFIANECAATISKYFGHMNSD
jgi:hypothetical protein